MKRLFVIVLLFNLFMVFGEEININSKISIPLDNIPIKVIYEKIGYFEGQLAQFRIHEASISGNIFYLYSYLLYDKSRNVISVCEQERVQVPGDRQIINSALIKSFQNRDYEENYRIGTTNEGNSYLSFFGPWNSGDTKDAFGIYANFDNIGSCYIEVYNIWVTFHDYRNTLSFNDLNNENEASKVIEILEEGFNRIYFKDHNMEK